MSELTTVARPYAKAAFDFAVEKQAVEHWQSMLVFGAAVASDETVKTILSGSQSADKLAQMFIDICGEQLDDHGQNLMKVLAENKRLTALPAISELFDALKAEYDKEIEVSVTAATPLSDEQQAALSASLEQRLARKIKLHCDVDASLVAGMVIKAGDMVIDGSVQTKLNRLADALQA